MTTLAFADLILGESADNIDVGTGNDNQRAAVGLVTQGRRTLDIASRDLDPAIYDNLEFVDAVRAMVLKSHHTKVRLLITNLGQTARAGHRLLELAAQVSSYIDVRMPAEQHSNFNQAFLIVDGTGLVYRKLADRFDGTACFHDPRRCGELLHEFDEMWEYSELDPDARRLGI